MPRGLWGSGTTAVEISWGLQRKGKARSYVIYMIDHARNRGTKKNGEGGVYGTIFSHQLIFLFSGKKARYAASYLQRVW